MRLLLLCFFLFAVTFAFAQNLIPDSSFENNMGLPINFSGIGYSNTWTRSTQGTTDLFCRCDKKKRKISVVDIPKNAMGYQETHSGDCYAGFFLYSHDVYREYLQTPLTAPLVKGKTYYLSLYISLADYSRTMIDQIGVCFGDSELHYPSAEVINNLQPLYIGVESVGRDTMHWKVLSLRYDARGGEKYLMIGSFVLKKIRKTNFPLPKGLKTAINKNSQRDAYYFIDDVSLREWINPPPLPEKKGAVVTTETKAKIISLNNIVFANGKSELSERIPELDSLISYMKKCPSVTIEINGHTDNSGTKKTNKKLSLERARAVAEYLHAQGIDEKRMLVNGYGSFNPIAPIDTEENKAKNRRVEIKIRQ